MFKDVCFLSICVAESHIAVTMTSAVPTIYVVVQPFCWGSMASFRIAKAFNVVLYIIPCKGTEM